jgi:hypothetical protein
MKRSRVINMGLENEITAALTHSTHYLSLYGTLEKALAELGTSSENKLLAVDYVEHILPISIRVSRLDQRFTKALGAARDFVEGKLSVDDVEPISRSVSLAHYRFQIRQEHAQKFNVSLDMQRQCLIDFELSSVVLTTCLVCYGHERASRGFLHTPPTQTSKTIAEMCANIIGLYVSKATQKIGNEIIGQESKERYEQGRIQEIRWQLHHLLEI